MPIDLDSTIRELEELADELTNAPPNVRDRVGALRNAVLLLKQQYDEDGLCWDCQQGEHCGGQVGMRAQLGVVLTCRCVCPSMIPRPKTEEEIRKEVARAIRDETEARLFFGRLDRRGDPTGPLPPEWKLPKRR